MKMKNGKSIFAVAALTVIFWVGSANSADNSADFATETQNLIARTIEANINNAVRNVGSDQTVFSEMQNRMMSTVSSAIKQNTAARKRAAVIETCMECRAMQPITFDITSRTVLFDAETQERINRAMAKRIEETIRVISSDPAVARSVQDKMMKERMAANPLRQNMQPFMMSRLFSDPTMINVAGKKDENSEKQPDKITCSAGDAGFPNC